MSTSHFSAHFYTLNPTKLDSSCAEENTVTTLGTGKGENAQSLQGSACTRTIHYPGCTDRVCVNVYCTVQYALAMLYCTGPEAQMPIAVPYGPVGSLELRWNA